MTQHFSLDLLNDERKEKFLRNNEKRKEKHYLEKTSRI